jgi:hypothetical protein
VADDPVSLHRSDARQLGGNDPLAVRHDRIGVLGNAQERAKPFERHGVGRDEIDAHGP